MYPIPQFVFNPGSGDITFSPTWPPTGKTPTARSAVRTDSITSSGLKQSVLEHTDMVETLNFTTVPESDLADWEAFIDFAEAGEDFLYYPDATETSTFFSCTLDDTDWNPARVAFQTYSFTLKLRHDLT